MGGIKFSLIIIIFTIYFLFLESTNSPFNYKVNYRCAVEGQAISPTIHQPQLTWGLGLIG